MKRVNVAAGVAVVIGLTLPMTVTHAQASISADLGVFSDYVWRGLSLTNRFVLQPDAYLSVPVGPGSVVVGAWANVEPGQYDDPDDEISEGGGTSSFDFTEIDLSAEYTQTFGTVTGTFGGIGYIYPNDAGLTSELNTFELYAEGQLDNVLLTPKLSAFYDVGKIDGLYLEGSVSRDLPVSPAFGITLGALAGFNAGQDLNAAEDNFANFDDSGFTHLDLSVASEITAGPVAIAPQFHLIIGGDEFTKITAPTSDNDTKVWFGALVSWARDLGDAPADAVIPDQ